MINVSVTLTGRQTKPTNRDASHLKRLTFLHFSAILRHPCFGLSSLQFDATSLHGLPLTNFLFVAFKDGWEFVPLLRDLFWDPFGDFKDGWGVMPGHSPQL